MYGLLFSQVICIVITQYSFLPQFSYDCCLLCLNEIVNFTHSFSMQGNKNNLQYIFTEFLPLNMVCINDIHELLIIFIVPSQKVYIQLVIIIGVSLSEPHTAGCLNVIFSIYIFVCLGTYTVILLIETAVKFNTHTPKTCGMQSMIRDVYLKRTAKTSGKKTTRPS